MNILLVIAALLVILLCGPISERRRYNNGICKQTGQPWEYFDTNSLRGRGYKSGNHVTWVSWPGIAKQQTLNSMILPNTIIFVNNEINY